MGKFLKDGNVSSYLDLGTSREETDNKGANQPNLPVSGKLAELELSFQKECNSSDFCCHVAIAYIPLCSNKLLHSSNSKESACNAGEPGLIPGSGRSPFRRAWQPTLVFLPQEFHGQRSLADYSP